MHRQQRHVPHPFPLQPRPFLFKTSSMKHDAISSFKLKLTPHKALLSDEQRKVLNPFRVHIVGAKKLPRRDPRSKLPVYIKLRFYDGQVICTRREPSAETIK